MAQQPHLPGVIPDRRRQNAPASGYATHFAYASNGICHEIHHELGERPIECPISEGQCLRCGHLRAYARHPVLARSYEVGRGIDSSDPLRAEQLLPVAESAPPGPQPTSRTRWPERTSANLINSSASSRP